MFVSMIQISQEIGTPQPEITEFLIGEGTPLCIRGGSSNVDPHASGSHKRRASSGNSTSIVVVVSDDDDEDSVTREGLFRAAKQPRTAAIGATLPSLFDVPITCADHPEQVLNWFCTDCKVLLIVVEFICRQCGIDLISCSNVCDLIPQLVPVGVPICQICGIMGNHSTCPSTKKKLSLQVSDMAGDVEAYFRAWEANADNVLS